MTGNGNANVNDNVTIIVDDNVITEIVPALQCPTAAV